MLFYLTRAPLKQICVNPYLSKFKVHKASLNISCHVVCIILLVCKPPGTSQVIYLKLRFTIEDLITFISIEPKIYWQSERSRIIGRYRFKGPWETWISNIINLSERRPVGNHKMHIIFHVYEWGGDVYQSYMCLISIYIYIYIYGYYGKCTKNVTHH